LGSKRKIQSGGLAIVMDLQKKGRQI